MQIKSLAIALALSTSIIASQALADEPFALTPSGATESYFDLSVIETSDLLANKCVDVGWTMMSSTETMVVCEAPVSTGTAILAALAGPRYATPPRQYFRFNLAGYQGFTRAQVSSWQETQTAFGQTQRTDLGNDNFHNGVMAFFKSIGGIFPPNTQFPNHASMMVDYEFVESPERGMLVSNVNPDGPFARAGIREGDIVTRMGRERIKGENDVSDGLHKAIKGDTFDVEFYRSGDKMKVAVPVEFRPDAGPLPETTRVDESPAATSTTIVQNEMSVAEELAKFAALRDQGILTEEEFAAQKAKLLAGS